MHISHEYISKMVYKTCINELHVWFCKWEESESNAYCAYFIKL